MLRRITLSVLIGISLHLQAPIASAAPITAPDVRQVRQGATVIVDVLSNDQGDGALQIVGFTQPQGGRVSENPGGGLQLALMQDFFGDLSFTYEVQDDSGEVSQGVVSVKVVRSASDSLALQDSVSIGSLAATQMQLLRSHSAAVSQWLKLSSADAGGGSAGDGLIPLGGVFASVHRQSLDSALVQGGGVQETDIQGLTVGADWNIGEQWVLGGALGLNSADSPMSEAEQTTDETSLLIFGQFHYGAWLAEGQVGFSQSGIEQVGTSSFATEGDAQFALVKAEYRFSGRAWQLLPGISFASNTSQVDAFSQQVGARQVMYSDFERKHVNATASLYGDYAVATSWGVLLPQLTIASHYCVDESEDGQALQINGEAFLAQSAGDDQYITLDAGIAFWLTHGLSGFVNYHRIERNSLLDLQGVNLGARWEF